ncbi:DUF3108 domain-containing protein, partial [Ideonella livida]
VLAGGLPGPRGTARVMLDRGDPPERRRRAPPPEAATTAASAAASAPPVPPPTWPAMPREEGPLAQSEAWQFAVPPPAVEADPEPPVAPPRYPVQLPPPLHLRYHVSQGDQGGGQGELIWRRGPQHYGIEQSMRLPGKTDAAWLSRGYVGESGLQPERMVERRRERHVQAVNFQRDKGVVSFSSHTGTAPLHEVSQDRASWVVQLAGILAARPEAPAAGERLILHVASPRGQSRMWVFEVGSRFRVETPSGTVMALHLQRLAEAPYDTTVDVWVAPQTHWLPLRMRFSPVPRGAAQEWLLQDPPKTLTPAPPLP